MGKSRVPPLSIINNSVIACKGSDHAVCTTETVGGSHAPVDSMDNGNSSVITNSLSEDPHVGVKDVDASTHNSVTEGTTVLAN